MVEQKPDPFNYPLRSPEEIKEDKRLNPPDFVVTVWLSNHYDGDSRTHSNIDYRSSVAKINFYLTDMKLSTL